MSADLSMFGGMRDLQPLWGHPAAAVLRLGLAGDRVAMALT
ncbi:hypothetical protein [Psychromicrobium xiongbiense]|nr:hypothetical protein [Psychromicrobium sp. YIM S02556]